MVCPSEKMSNSQIRPEEVKDCNEVDWSSHVPCATLTAVSITQTMSARFPASDRDVFLIVCAASVPSQTQNWCSSVKFRWGIVNVLGDSNWMMQCLDASFSVTPAVVLAIFSTVSIILPNSIPLSWKRDSRKLQTCLYSLFLAHSQLFPRGLHSPIDATWAISCTSLNEVAQSSHSSCNESLCHVNKLGQRSRPRSFFTTPEL